MQSRTGAIVALLLVALAAPAHLKAEDCVSTPTSMPFIVFDFTDPKDTKVANRIYSFAGDTKGVTKAALTIQDPTSLDATIKTLRTSAPDVSDRFITAKGGLDDRIEAICVHASNATCTADFVEKKRSTQLGTDLKTLVKIAKAIRGLAEAATPNDTNAPPPHTVATCTVYTLTTLRAEVTTTATLNDDTDNALKTKVITGPIEHWYLSADLPVDDVKKLKYNSDDHSLAPKDTPTSFMIGVDFKFGDVLTHETAFTRNIALKGLVKASKHPLDEYGVGIALRGQYLKRLGIDFDLFSPFVAWTTFKEDAVDANNQPLLNSHRKSAVRAGISFNLDTALGWLKSSDSDKGDDKKE